MRSGCRPYSWAELQVLVLLTDGRVDAYQAHEVRRLSLSPLFARRNNIICLTGTAEQYCVCHTSPLQRCPDAMQAVHMMERLSDEQANCSLHAFGVGRGVDKVCRPAR